MSEVVEGTHVHHRSPEVPGVFYHVTLASGMTMNDEVVRIIGDVIEQERNIILHFDPEGEHKGREIDVERLLSAEPSKND